mgnify:CR=1 FL=1
MPLTKLQFKPGVNREVTSYSNEGGWRDCDKIRFRFGYPEKMGGWQKYTSSTYLGTVRALHNWVALDGSNYLGLGSHIKYYIEEGGQLNDITPVRSITSQGDVTFAAVTSAPFSSTITVTDVSHGASESDFVTFASAESLGGAITAAVLNQEYQIDNVVDANTYEITAKNPTTGASVLSTASDTGVGGQGVGTVSVSGTAVAASGINAVTVTTNATGVGVFTFSNPSGTGVGNFTISGASTGSATTNNVVQTSTSGSGTSAEFTVVASSGDYTVTVTDVGSGYAVGDTILIEGQNIGGTQGTHDLTLTITHLQGASVGTATHTGETQTATSGSGSNAEFTVVTDGDGGYTVDVTTVGSGYAVGDTITIAGTGIGGTSPANDLVLTITQLSGTSVGPVKIYTGLTQTSTSGSGSNAEFSVGVDLIGGYSVDVTAIGSGYAVNDTITIAGTNFDSTLSKSPANDLTFTINSLVSVSHTSIAQSATSGSGAGASFNLTRDGNAAYTVTSVAAIGLGYNVNDTITLPGASLGGSTPANNATLTVTSLSHPTIATYQINVGLDTTVGGTGWGAGLYYGVTNGAAQTTLNQGGTLSSSATTVTVTTSAPGGHQIVINDVIQIENELMLVTNVSSNNLTVIRGFDGTGTGATNSDGSSNVNTLGPTAATTHVDGSVVRLATGNANSIDDFSGWGDAASGGLTTTTQIRLWSHDNFGEDLLLNPRDDQIYYWDRTNNLTSRAVKLNTLSGTKLSVPTKCKQVMVSDRDRHVIAFGADDLIIESTPTQENGDGVQDPLLIRFSTQENPLIWYPLATNTAGSLRLGSGSTFMQAVETKREILVWTDTALTSMRFIGPPFTFGLQQLSNNITIMSPNAAVATEDFVFWMGIDTFYVYAGQTQTLPCTVRDKVFLDFNIEQRDKVVAGVNTEFSEVTWFYPSSNASDNDRYVTYNYGQKIWYFGTLSRTAWLDRGTRTFPIATANSLIYNHEIGYDDDGSAMDSFIESTAIDIGDGDKFLYLRKVIPDLTFEGSTNLSTPQATFTVKARNNPGADFDSTQSGTAIRTQSTPVEKFTEQLDLRVRGRSFALRVESNALGSKWKLGSPRVDIRQDGRR